MRVPRLSIRPVLGPILGVLVLVLVGCGGQPSGGPPAPSGATRTVVDMTGRSVELPAEVTRIATDFPALNATLLVVGAADRLVATSPGVGPLYDTLVPTYKAVPQPFDSSLTKVNEEALIAAKPQVVLISAGGKAMLPTFERLGIPAIVFASFQNPQQLKDGVKLVADVVGGAAPAKAKEFADYYDANIARVQAKTAGIAAAARPSAYYTAANPTQTEGQNSIVEAWMDESGAQNMAAANGVNTAPAFATVNLEDVLRWDPDVVICRDFPTRAEILGDPRWQRVTAVRDQKVFVNPTGVYVWSVRSAESALQPLWAATTFHPELFADIDMAQEVKKFYSTFYSYDLSDEQVAAILNPTSA